MAWICAALVIVGFVISLPGTALMRALGRRVGAMDSPGVDGQVKVDARRVPTTGGVAIFAGIAAPIAAGLIGAWLVDPSAVSAVSETLADHLPGIRLKTPLVLTFLGCLTVLHLMGLIDDRKPLGAGPKMLVMLGVSLAIVLVSPSRLLEFLTAYPGGFVVSLIVTVLWITAVTNAFNFIDNMDGLCAGVAAIAGTCFLIATIITGQWFVAAMLALVVGSSLGFLVLNFPPASIFMGDGGSLVLGFTLAFLTVQATYFGVDNSIVIAGNWYATLMPLVVLAVPLYDFTSVLAIRVSQGSSPFVGDLQHFSHRLVERGLSRRAAVMVILGITMATGISGISLASLRPWQAALVGLQTLVLLAVLGLFEHRARDRESSR